nr:MAG TPA: hypothetical protein [Microviridae sp.]
MKTLIIARLAINNNQGAKVNPLRLFYIRHYQIF